MKRWVSFLFFLLLLGESVTFAGERDLLQLEEVLASVNRYHPTLEAARQEMGVARGEQLAAEGGFDPKVKVKGEWEALGYYRNVFVDASVEQPTKLRGLTFFGGYRLGQGKFPGYEYKYFTNNYGELRAGLRLPLLRDAGTDKYRTTLAKSERMVAASEAGVSVAKLELIQKATEKYWEWVTAGRKLVLARELLQRAKERDQAIAVRVEQGDMARMDRTDNVRAILAREQQVVSAERVLGKAQLELSLYLRNEKGEPILASVERLPKELQELIPLPPNTLEKALEIAIQRRPERLRYEALRDQYALEEAYFDNQRLTAVDLQLVGAKQFGAGYPEKLPSMVEVGLSIELPVRTRAQEGRRGAALAKREQYEALLRLAQDKIRVEVRDAALAMETALRRADWARQETEAARQLEEAERRRFAAGDGNMLFVNLREQATFDAATKELDTRLEFAKARAAFRAASGEL